MKFQVLFCGNSKKNISKCLLLKFLLRVLRIHCNLQLFIFLQSRVNAPTMDQEFDTYDRCFINALTTVSRSTFPPFIPEFPKWALSS